MLNMLALKITWGCDQWPDVPTHRAPLASGHADQGGDVETLSRLSGVIINIAMIGLAATATHGIPGPGCGQARQRSCIKYSGSPPPHFQIVQDFCTGHLQITALSEILRFRKITNLFKIEILWNGY